MKRETESLLIRVQNNNIRINYLVTKIDNTQMINKCRLCSDKAETVNHIKSECNKLEETECKTWHNGIKKKIIAMRQNTYNVSIRLICSLVIRNVS